MTVIITIDGPAAAGKSTVARRLATELGFDFLDTGATYRAITLKALCQKVDFENPEQLARLAADTDISFSHSDDHQTIYCDGTDVTEELRTQEVTEKIHYLADEPKVRRALIEVQREYAEGRNVVSEGRDQGTEVFPEADVKFYLDASTRARARRRMKDIEAAGGDGSLEAVLSAIQKRDEHDRNRPMGSLRQSEDMIVVDSTNLSINAVLERMKHIVKERIGSKSASG